MMKRIHHLRASWLFAAMIVAVVIGETLAWYISRILDWRFPAVAVGAVCVGLVAAAASWLYDGRE
jgi:predicted MFS family arabinose efflux permease